MKQDNKKQTNLKPRRTGYLLSDDITSRHEKHVKAPNWDRTWLTGTALQIMAHFFHALQSNVCYREAMRRKWTEDPTKCQAETALCWLFAGTKQTQQEKRHVAKGHCGKCPINFRCGSLSKTTVWKLNVALATFRRSRNQIPCWPSTGSLARSKSGCFGNNFVKLQQINMFCLKTTCLSSTLHAAMKSTVSNKTFLSQPEEMKQFTHKFWPGEGVRAGQNSSNDSGV